MSAPNYHLVRLTPGYDLEAFDCEQPVYNQWLVADAGRAVTAGSAMVYLLIEREAPADEAASGRVVGYFAICPTLVVRDDAPPQLRRGMLRAAPGWLLAKLALDRSLRRDKQHHWGRQLLREALLTIVAAADVGGGQIIVVDPDNPRLVDWYAANGFLATGGPGLRMYMKVATARAHLQPQPSPDETRP